MILANILKKIVFLLIIFIPISLYTKTHLEIKSKLETELNNIQKKTVETYNELLMLNKAIKNLNIEIKRNKQSQLIYKKYIDNEEILAEGLILLLQEKYYNEPIKKFFQNFSKKNNYITKKIVKEYFLENIKTEINIYFSGLRKIEGLDKELNIKNSLLAQKRLKIKKKRKKLDAELKKRKVLQRKNPKSKIYKKKENIVKQKAKNINELLKGVSSNRTNKNSNIKSKKVSLPVSGNIISQFGEKKDSFLSKAGIMFELSEESYVTAPINGMVIFTGKWRNYGNIIIIENTDHYHTILSGMDEIMTFSGNKVLKGEPIAKFFVKQSSSKKLYFQLRFKGKPIDPKREVEIL
ncbi:MAG: hypothetical protein CMP41_04005 [Rickettsiales bacterium]|nr:hypothetical protein [Rickettsiales bacterium]